MKLIEAWFSWEVDPQSSSTTIVFPSLRVARKEAKELMKYIIESNRETCQQYGLDSSDATYTVTFDRVTVTKITPESLCYIINNGGGGYVAERVTIHKMQKTVKGKKARK